MTGVKQVPDSAVPVTESGGNYHSALARLLVDAAARAQLRAAPDVTAARFGLTAAELSQLKAIDTERLEISAGGITRARTRALRRLLAITFSLYGPAIEPSAAAFLAADVPPAGGDEVARSLAAGQRFAAFLATAGGRPAAAEIARLELLRAELLLSAPARPAQPGEKPAARNGGGWLPDADEFRPAVGAHARLAAFTVDVLAARPGQDPARWEAPAATRVLLVRPAGSAAVQVSRVSRSVYEVLSRCDGTRTVAEIRHAVPGGCPARDGAPDEVRALIGSALEAGLLQLR